MKIPWRKALTWLGKTLAEAILTKVTGRAADPDCGTIATEQPREVKK